MHLDDPTGHMEMIEGLESRYKVEECGFRTIYENLQGYRIFASRKVAEKIEKQTRYEAQLYNVDVRQDQRYMAEHDIFPCGQRDESRFSPDFTAPLTSLQVEVAGDPSTPGDISRIRVLNDRTILLNGSERTVISDLMELVKSHDPDLIICPYADTWVPIMFTRQEIWLGADNKSDRLVQSDGLQVILELWKGQPQGWSHDSGGKSFD